MSKGLRCWLIWPEDGDGALLVLHHSRGAARAYYAETIGITMCEMIDTPTRDRRVSILDGYQDEPGEVFENGPYLLAGCWTDCISCDVMIHRTEADDHLTGIYLGGWGYCPDCAAQKVTGVHPDEMKDLVPA